MVLVKTLTINFLDKSFKCRGGVIMPGPYTQLSALIEKTEALSSRELKFNFNVLADNTKDAISNGILYGIAGGIKHVIEQVELQADNNEDVRIIVTGGAAKIIVDALEMTDLKFKTDEKLVEYLC